MLTIGNFDGVHRGHQTLIDRLKAKAADLGVAAVLLTFEPLPREFFQGEAVPARLTRFREKMLLLRAAGLDRVVLLPFNEKTAALEPEAIASDLLHHQLGVQHLVVGDDFRFGHRAAGDYAFLERAGARLGFSLEQCGTLLQGTERISSTRIRSVLAAGAFDAAATLLGRPYAMLGRVVYGRQLGRELGVPTANLRLQRYRSPLNGVFAVTAITEDGASYGGVANVGVRPTVDGVEPLLEVHLFQFQGDLYGQRLSVTFRHKLRDEQKFDGLPALKAQLERDLSEARAYLASAELPAPLGADFLQVGS